MNKNFSLKLLLLFTIGFLAVPVSAVEYVENQKFQVPEAASARSFSRPYDSRFQYGLPERGQSVSVFGRKDKSVESSYDDDEEVVLDSTNIAPKKKIIKKISSDPVGQNVNQGRNDVPMNYDSFPKFYDSNDMMNQQFMPMMSY